LAGLPPRTLQPHYPYFLLTTDLKFDHHTCLWKSRLEQLRGGNSSNGVRNGCCSPSFASRRRAVGCMTECGCVVASNEGIGGSVSFASELASQTEQRPHRAVPAKQCPPSAQPGASPDIILETVRMVLRGREMRELPAYGINITFDDGVVVTCRVCRTSWGVGRRQFTTAAWWSCPRGCGRIPPRPSDTARIS
jgi:hypothetical protein